MSGSEQLYHGGSGSVDEVLFTREQARLGLGLVLLSFCRISRESDRCVKARDSE
jgi:hypothetical protein